MNNPRFNDEGSGGNNKPVWRNWWGAGNANFKLGKADANIASRTTGTVSIYTGSLGSESDSTNNLTGVFNLSDQQADLNTWVLLLRVNGEWALLPLECPA